MAEEVVECCELCRFAGAHADNDALLLCRHQSPMNLASSGAAMWPIVKVRDWCGDFEEDNA